jgi:hypothetical protein
MRAFLWNTFPSTDYISRLSNVVDFRRYFLVNAQAPTSVKCSITYLPLLLDIARGNRVKRNEKKEIRIMRLEPHNTINHFTCACFRYLTLMLTFYVTRCAHYNLRCLSFSLLMRSKNGTILQYRLSIRCCWIAHHYH